MEFKNNPPELYPEEKKMPLAKYYLPVLPPEPLKMQLIDAGPMDPGDAVKAENFLDVIKPVGEYDKINFGYCMMPDGSGYIALYERSGRRVTGKMNSWYMRWMNFRSKSMVPGHGNLRYKIWMPLDHIDHAYVNGRDRSDGIRTLETLDMGVGSKPVESIHHRITMQDMGMSKELEEQYAGQGYTFRVAWESFSIPGSHFCFDVTRPCPQGGFETISREWIGWRPEGGTLIRDEATPVDEEYLKNVVIHNVIEHAHLPRFLPALYEEYKDKPLDAD